MFNNGTFKIIASLRKDDPKDPDHTLLAGFTSDVNSCLFSLSEDAKGTDYALIRREKIDVKRS